MSSSRAPAPIGPSGRDPPPQPPTSTALALAAEASSSERRVSPPAGLTRASHRPEALAPPMALPPDGRVQVLDLVERPGVDPGGEVLPTVIRNDEDDIALVQLARDPHGDARDRPRRDAGEQALLVEQL